jgi:uncharacterized membrane protein
MPQRALLIAVVVASTFGFAFAATSTSDFVAHLDRQVHGIHCSFLPGVGAADVTGSSGCHTTLMSPYSSVMRDRVWGGIPVSLPAMAVFAYLAFFAIALLVTGRTEDRRATGYLALATTLPLLTSIVFGYISLRELDAACKLCIGIYASSTVAFVAALIAFLRTRSALPRSAMNERLGPAPRIARRTRDAEPIDLDDDRYPSADRTVRDEELEDRDGRGRALGTADTIDAASSRDPRRLATESEMDRRVGFGPRAHEARRGPISDRPDAPLGWGVLGGAFALGVLFVLAPVVAYAAGAPDFQRYSEGCGTLASPNDPGRVLVPLGAQSGGTDVIEVLDPLCPACRGFERRFSGLPAASQVDRRVLLFPLDSECNWMVDRPIHAGACAISEAMLCAGDGAEQVLAWAFEHQEEIRTATERDPGAALRMARERFPDIRTCIGSPEARNRLNRGLRWAVANHLPVLTPQVYVGGTRVCDADTDLGLDWTLARMLERNGGSR